MELDIKCSTLPDIDYTNVEILYCHDCKIKKLKFMPNLIEIRCGATNIRKIPLHLFPKLKILRCSYTRIKSIPNVIDICVFDAKIKDKSRMIKLAYNNKYLAKIVRI